jgi:hypothetical protein
LEQRAEVRRALKKQREVSPATFYDAGEGWKGWESGWILPHGATAVRTGKRFFIGALRIPEINKLPVAPRADDFCVAIALPYNPRPVEEGLSGTVSKRPEPEWSLGSCPIFRSAV